MSLTLRPAALLDFARLWAWRTDPVTVSAFFGAPPEDLCAHYRWLSAILQTDTARLFIAEDDGVAVGTGRLDLVDGRAEVSITIAPEHRGCGYALELVRALLLRVPVTWPSFTVRAVVKLENVHSLRAFAAAGFLPVVFKPSWVILQWPADGSGTASGGL